MYEEALAKFQNDDGVPDLALGAPSQSGNGGMTRGAVSVRSGATGAERFRLFPANGPDVNFWGLGLTLVGDLDGDGRPELAVSDPGAGQLGQPVGFVDLVSLATRAPIRRLQGTVLAGGFGTAVADLGDVDADGVSDILVGEPGNAVDQSAAAWVFSGATGRASTTARSPAPARGAARLVGRRARRRGRRRHPRLRRGRAAVERRSGTVVIRSGRSGGSRAQVNGTVSSMSGFPIGEVLGSVLAAADLDGDGRRELVVGGTPIQIGGTSVLAAGYVRAYRLAPSERSWISGATAAPSRTARRI